MKWVLIKKIVELFGYTEDASRSKIKKGVWLKGIHWTKAPDGRIFFNTEEIQRWILSKEYRAWRLVRAPLI
jgi:hypothetical protein